MPDKNQTSLKRKIAYCAIATLVIGGAVVFALPKGTLAQMMHNKMHAMHSEGGGMGHDMTNMPGLQGLDATKEESDELAIMFNNFPEITRTVTNLPNGIRTLTHSQDEEIMAVVVSHVVGMINRVDEGRDPKIFIQSPTLDILFERRAAITTEIETTDAGIIVTQTSDDPDVVAALHTHAGEVSAMVDRGMVAVHEMMAKRAGN